MDILQMYKLKINRPREAINLIIFVISLVLRFKSRCTLPPKCLMWVSTKISHKTLTLYLISNKLIIYNVLNFPFRLKLNHFIIQL